LATWQLGDLVRHWSDFTPPTPSLPNCLIAQLPSRLIAQLPTTPRPADRRGYLSWGTQEASSNHFLCSKLSSPLFIKYATKFCTQFKNSGSLGDSAMPIGS